MGYDYSMLGKLQPTGRRTPWVVRYISFPLILAGLFAAFVISSQPTNKAEMGTSIMTTLANVLILLAVAAVTIVPLVYLAYQFFVTRRRNRAITMFGLVNGLKSLSQSEAASELPAALKQISAGTVSNAYGFKAAGGTSIDIMEYKYSLRGKDKDTDYYSTIAVFNTKNTMPHVFLDSKRDGLIYTYSSSQKVNLEGDFSKYYSVYSPEIANIELRQIFTPDVMQALIASDAQYDVELDGNKGALIAPGFIYSRDKLPAFLEFAERLRKDVDKESVDWDVMLQTAGHRNNGATSTQLRRNYRSLYIALGWLLSIALIYGIVLLLTSR